MLYCWGSWWLILWSQLPSSAGLRMLCGAGFSWTNMVAAQGWLMGGGERLVQAHFTSKSQSSPAQGCLHRCCFGCHSLPQRNSRHPSWPSGRLWGLMDFHWGIPDSRAAFPVCFFLSASGAHFLSLWMCRIISSVSSCLDSTGGLCSPTWNVWTSAARDVFLSSHPTPLWITNQCRTDGGWEAKPDLKTFPHKKALAVPAEMRVRGDGSAVPKHSFISFQLSLWGVLAHST